MGYKNKLNPFTGKLQKVFDGTSDNSPVVKNSNNIAVLAFRVAINGVMSLFQMIDRIIDEYEDESGIDTVQSVNENYDSSFKLYTPTGGVSLPQPYLHVKCNDNNPNTVVVNNGIGSESLTSLNNTDTMSVAGKINQALQFNGTTDRISLDSIISSIENDTVGSISFWVNLDSVSAGNARGRFLSLGSTLGESAWTVYHDEDTFTFRISNNNLNFASWSLGAGTFTVGVWSHWFIIQDGVSLKIYKDNVDVTPVPILGGTGSASSWISLATSLDRARIGNINWDPDGPSSGELDYLPGKLDDMRYFSGVALTSVQRDLIYNSGSGTEAEQILGTFDNMALISKGFTAQQTPNEARVIVREEDIDSVTLNTDLKAYLSRDDGTTWTEATLEVEDTFDASSRILSAVADVSGQPSGTNIRYKLQTFNETGLKIHATSALWKI